MRLLAKYTCHSLADKESHVSLFKSKKRSFGLWSQDDREGSINVILQSCEESIFSQIFKKEILGLQP